MVDSLSALHSHQKEIPMVTIEKVMDGLVQFMEKEFIPHLPPKGWQRPLCATVIAMSRNSLHKLINEYKNNPMLVGIGIFDENGMVDIDTVKDEFSKHLSAEGMIVSFPLIGDITFHQSDVEKLYYYIVNS